ncbi:adenylyltransferase/sulfurtransferase [Chitinophaga skermanii]|uniref:Molybdopterin-synthase adenylyltransferase n=1 Tax=Chitinophaga skermanii TaxID=331697 RepID=A0A327Q7T4_9BACT|nr:ThiF family adenylyltransferase [Chitinophaga skermanii]RAI97836.1 adenylyltransferase/sulfurtransferase [Chitinophaga skermanii]
MDINEQAFARYHRQIRLPGFGIASQERLQAAKVLVVGAGGLGCPILASLAGAGVGTIGIVDDGLVELSNLHRQFLFGMNDIGLPKVDIAARQLAVLNPSIQTHTYNFLLTNHNAIDLLTQYDIVLDGTDNFTTRYMLADACAFIYKPLIYGAVSRFEGQVAVFENGLSYRDVFPVPPKPGEVQNCEEAGVLGYLPGIIGNMMAGECLKWITKLGTTLSGKLLTFSALDNRFLELDIDSTAEGKLARPTSKEEFESRDYAMLCGTIPLQAREISVEEFRIFTATETPSIIDVRELHEEPSLGKFPHERVPLQTFLQAFPYVGDGAVIFVCQSGKRSLQAAELYAASHPHRMVYSLRGGVIALLENGLL